MWIGLRWLALVGLLACDPASNGAPQDSGTDTGQGDTDTQSLLYQPDNGPTHEQGRIIAVGGRSRDP